MKKHLLITGFGAFPGVKINPSARLAEKLAGLGCWKRLGWKVKSAVLPVSYGPTEKALGKLLEKSPRAVLMFGVAARRKTISIEMLARNRTSPNHRDHTGKLPKTSGLDSGPAILKGRAPMPVLRDVMRHQGLPARLSLNAGHYLCNAGYRYVLRHTATHVPVVFVHIPRVKRMGDQRGVKFAPLLAGSQIIARRLVLSARLSGA